MLLKFRYFLDSCILAGLSVGAVVSALALLGSIVPILDAINHFQLVIMLLAIIALAASFVWPSALSPLKRYGRLLVLFILFCSSCVLVPELVQRQFSISADASPSTLASTSPMKLVSFNIYMGTRDGKALANTLINATPDVVTLQEFAPKRFRNQPDLKKEFPYQARCQSWRICALGILSKHRLSDITPYDIGSKDQRNPLHGKLLAATVHMKGSKPVRLYSVHLAWPLPLSEKLNQLDKLKGILEKERERWPLQILAGDFNSTGWAFRLDDFTKAVSMDRRDHFLPTFPSPNSMIKHQRLPAFLSLDHIITTKDIKADPVVRLRAPIGDHWPISTTLYIPN